MSDGLADDAPGPVRASELNESVRLLHALLAELDEKKRTVFVLSELEELLVPEIAEIIGANLNTVYARQRAARAHFEAALNRHRLRERRVDRGRRPSAPATGPAAAAIRIPHVTESRLHGIFTILLASADSPR